MRHMFIIAAAILAVGGVTGACSDSKSDAGSTNGAVCSDAGHVAPWNYANGDPEGPLYWGDIKLDSNSPAYPDCAIHTEQHSPIAISKASTGQDPRVKEGPFQLGSELAWSSAASVESVHHNGHAWLATFNPTQNKLTIDGTLYDLAQFHFHSPAEHSLDGKDYPLEAHFVHLHETGAQPFAAVITVMFEEGEEDNEELAKVWSKFGACYQKDATAMSGITLDLTKLLPKNRTYITYDGSLTTPPCSFDVRFHIFLEPLKVSRTQLLQLQQAVGKNNRPHQPILNDTPIAIHRP